jgi:hypothetical protein
MSPKFLLVLFSLLFLSADQPKLVKVKVNKDITISVPKDWRPMDELDFRERYPSVRAPLAAYTDPDRRVDFAVNVSATQWPDADINLAARFFKASVTNMFDRVTMIDEGIRKVNGKSFIYFVFESRVNGARDDAANADPILRYNYLQYLVEPGRTLVFSFSCPRRDRPSWESSAQEMMDNIRIK